MHLLIKYVFTINAFTVKVCIYNKRMHLLLKYAFTIKVCIYYTQLQQLQSQWRPFRRDLVQPFSLTGHMYRI